jgi:hypothetical protein
MFGMTCWETHVGLSDIEAVHSVRGIVMIQKFHDRNPDVLIGFEVYLPASTDNQVDTTEQAIKEWLNPAQKFVGAEMPPKREDN